MNLNTKFSVSLLALTVVVLTGCQSSRLRHSDRAQGTSGVAYQSEVRRGSNASETFEFQSDFLDARHSNRATREPQYIPN